MCCGGEQALDKSARLWGLQHQTATPASFSPDCLVPALPALLVLSVPCAGTMVPGSGSATSGRQEGWLAFRCPIRPRWESWLSSSPGSKARQGFFLSVPFQASPWKAAPGVQPVPISRDEQSQLGCSPISARVIEGLVDISDITPIRKSHRHESVHCCFPHFLNDRRISRFSLGKESSSGPSPSHGGWKSHSDWEKLHSHRPPGAVPFKGGLLSPGGSLVSKTFPLWKFQRTFQPSLEMLL